MVVLWAGTILGVVGLVAVVIAWRSGNRAALRVAAGALIITALLSVPAFFVDVDDVEKFEEEVRTTAVFAQSEELPLAETPTTTC